VEECETGILFLPRCSYVSVIWSSSTRGEGPLPTAYRPPYRISKCYRSLISPKKYFPSYERVVLYGCETWSLTLTREELRLTLRRMNSYTVRSFIICTHPQILLGRSNQREWDVARKGGERNVYQVLAGKPEGKSPLERSRHRWTDEIRMDLRETGWV
jgi:hypothetical protein